MTRLHDGGCACCYHSVFNMAIVYDFFYYCRSVALTTLVAPFDRKAKEVKSHTRKLHDLKLAFSEFYLSLILLQNYQNLNFTGFRKILKKHDKLLGK